MKPVFKTLFLFIVLQGYAQVGVNTTTPEATFEVKAVNSATPSNTDGFLTPRIDAFPAINPTAAQQGMMVYLTTTSGTNLPGFYYWDNPTASWVGLFSTANADKDWYKVGTTTAPSAITDDMFHDGKVGIGINNPLSKLHVATSSTGMVPHTSSLITLESNTTSAYMSLFSNTVTGLLFGANANSQEGFLLYNHPVLPSGFLFRANNNVRFSISGDSKVGIGTNLPEFPLHLTDFTVGDKISLFGATGPHYGFGIQSALLQMHSAGITDDIAFGYGSSAAFTENMRIKGNGNVGIGTSNPTVPLHFASVLGDKISLWGTGANHYGFGVQNTLLQIHSDFDYSDIAFGYGSSTAFTENVRFTGNGFVGIGNNNPTVPLHFPSTLGNKIALWGAGSSNYGFSVQSLALQIHTSNSNGDVVFGSGNTASLTETMRIKGNGFVGIGDNSPTVPLSFASILGNKISLWGNSSANYGFSVQSLALQIHTANSNGDVVFGSGNTASLTETMRVKGTGEVGIGTNAPTAKLHLVNTSTGITPNPNSQIVLDNTGYSYMNLTSTGESGVIFGTNSGGTNGGIVYNSGTYTDGMSFRTGGNINRISITSAGNTEINGFTKMGTTAPAVKMIKLTGTTSNTQGTQTAIPHGLTSSKILSVSVLVEYATGASVPPSYNGSAGYEYDYFINTTSITVWPKSGNSANILSKSIRILVTYEE